MDRAGKGLGCMDLRLPYSMVLSLYLALLLLSTSQWHITCTSGSKMLPHTIGSKFTVRSSARGRVCSGGDFRPKGRGENISSSFEATGVSSSVWDVWDQYPVGLVE